MPDQGEVFIPPHLKVGPSHQPQQLSWMRAVCLTVTLVQVLQVMASSPALFNQSIAFNVLFGADDPTSAEAKEEAKLICTLLQVDPVYVEKLDDDSFLVGNQGSRLGMVRQLSAVPHGTSLPDRLDLPGRSRCA